MAVLKCCFCLSCTIYSLFGDCLSLCLCDLVKLIWQGSWRTCVGLGNLSSRRGYYLVVLAARGYFEIVGKDTAFVSLMVWETLGFLLMVRKHLSSSCWTQEVVFCFPPQICCTSLSLSSTLLKGLNKGVKGAWEWDYELLFFSTALCIWLLIVMLQMVQLEIHPFFGCQNVPVQSLMVNGKEMGECWIALCMFASSSCFEHNQKPRLFIYLKKVC